MAKHFAKIRVKIDLADFVLGDGIMTLLVIIVQFTVLVTHEVHGIKASTVNEREIGAAKDGKIQLSKEFTVFPKVFVLILKAQFVPPLHPFRVVGRVTFELERMLHLVGQLNFRVANPSGCSRHHWQPDQSSHDEEL